MAYTVRRRENGARRWANRFMKRSHRAQKGVSATGGWCPQPVSVGVGKRRWYATISERNTS